MLSVSVDRKVEVISRSQPASVRSSVRSFLLCPIVVAELLSRLKVCVTGVLNIRRQNIFRKATRKESYRDSKKRETLDDAKVLGFGEGVVKVGDAALFAAGEVAYSDGCGGTFWWHTEMGVIEWVSEICIGDCYVGG